MKRLIDTLITDLTAAAMVLAPLLVLANPAMHIRPCPPLPELWRLFWAAYGL